MIRSFWEGLGRGGRVGVAAGLVLITAITGAVAWWALHAEYQVLFADLSPQDASAMAAELDRQKIPFTVVEQEAGSGTTILVDRKDVHRTRLKVMGGGNVPLHGAVGLELFDNSDFGMTEFAQKVNYQRALQGELTRTVLSLSEVRDARVLLVLPEQGLFKQAGSKAKASVTLSLKQGQTLRPEQVAGIQRLIAAAVPGILPEDVTLIDQWGVALTRPAGDGEANAGSSRLDLKKDAEAYLSRKATEVLERALGPGEALASVDVTLNLDRVQTTTEDVVGAPGKGAGARTGVIVRERATVRDFGGGAFAVAATDAGPGAGGTGGSTQREVEYAVGRRVEQVVSQPGSVRRLQVVAVVKRALDPSQEERFAKMVAASVGASAERGDTVIVHSIEAMGGHPEASPPPQHPDAEAGWTQVAPGAVERAGGEPPRGPRSAVAALASSKVLAPLAGLLALVAIWASRRRPVRAGERERTAGAALTEAEREAALAQVQSWLRGAAGEKRPPGRRP
jgi:flagellar M-ring protein FliF